MTLSKPDASKRKGLPKIKKKENRRIIFVALVLGVAAWIIEGFVDFFIFHHGTLIQNIIWPEHHTLLHRSIIVITLILFSGYTLVLLNRRKKAQDEIQRSYDIQTILNELLKLHLEKLSFDEILEKIIGRITSISWLTMESKGLIMLVSDLPNTLEIRAHKGLSHETLKVCARLPFGKCICGRVAKTERPIFANCLNELHDVRYKGISPHGHYCVPIQTQDNKILGVLNLYVKEGHIRNKKEEGFIRAIANVIATLIEQKQAQDEIKKAYEELKKTQSKLIQSEKIAGMGTLAAGVAHEINNPLQVIIGMSEMILEDDDLEQVRVDAKELIGASERIQQITSNLTSYSRDVKTTEVQALDLNDIINKSMEMSRFNANFRSIDLKTELTDIGIIDGNQGELEQVFINLFGNAVDAMEGEGKLTIRSGMEDGVLLVQISDTGNGIPAENMGKIFDPFFTTKEVGKGTGLGLYVVHQIVEKHKGTIDVTSEVGKGTTFTLIFPVTT